MAKFLDSLRLILLLSLMSSSLFGQNKWAETHSIVNPVELNGINVFEVTTDSIVALFGEPSKISSDWNPYSDENLIVYHYQKSLFYFYSNKHLYTFKINDKKLNKTVIKINNHSVGDSINGLAREYYKSVLNMKDNEVSIHLLYDFQIVGMLMNFIIKGDAIKSIELIDLET